MLVVTRLRTPSADPAAEAELRALMVHALDEPSAYEVVEEGTDLNEAQPRSIG